MVCVIMCWRNDVNLQPHFHADTEILTSARYWFTLCSCLSSCPVVRRLLLFGRHSCRFRCRHMLSSSASSASQLPSPTLLRVVLVLIFLPVTRSLFTYFICYRPCVLHVHTISTYSSLFYPKLCYSHFFSKYSFFFFTFKSLGVLTAFLQKLISVLNSFFFNL